MNWSHLFTSTIGKKIVVAVTGLFLVSFLVIHVGINSCVFKDLFVPDDNGDMFNRAADFMARTVVIRIMEYVLFAGFLFISFRGWLSNFKIGRKERSGMK